MASTDDGRLIPGSEGGGEAGRRGGGGESRIDGFNYRSLRLAMIFDWWCVKVAGKLSSVVIICVYSRFGLLGRYLLV